MHYRNKVMDKSIKIGIIGDASHVPQIKTDEALNHASNRLSIKTDPVRIPTASLNSETVKSKIMQFNGIWAGPGDYENPKGVIAAVRYCREEGIPFLGT